MASTYLSRTFGTADNYTKQTFSAWVKRGSLGGSQMMISGYNGSSSWSTQIDFNSDQLRVEFGGASQNEVKTNALYRDTNAWYHIVIAIDTTQATASDRIKFYVNGEQITSFAISNYPAQNDNSQLTSANSNNTVGASFNSNDKYDGSMAHVHFIDGTTYDADTFGETDATTGIWKPKTAPSVTYGTNGFFLKFENSAAFGTDSSGNANNFTVNGTMTQTIDTPSNVFATWNPLFPNSGLTFSNGNLGVVANDANYRHCVSTLGASSGKYYAEFKAVSGFSSVDKNVGIYRTDNNYSATTGLGNYTTGTTWSYGANGLVRTNNGTNDTEATFTDGDIISVAMDLDNNKLYFAKNGTWINSGDPTSGATGTGAYTIISNGEPYHFGATSISSGGAGLWQANFGNGIFGTTAVSSAQNPDDGIGIFEYDVPTGYRALCTKSINAEEYD